MPIHLQPVLHAMVFSRALEMVAWERGHGIVESHGICPHSASSPRDKTSENCMSSHCQRGLWFLVSR